MPASAAVVSLPTVTTNRYLGIFLLAFATLAYQIVITRIFSVTLYYHFAFAGVSLAMLGLTIGALRVYFDPDRYGAERLPQEFARCATLFSLTSIGVVALYLRLPALVPSNVGRHISVLSLGLFVIPFLYSGISVALLLTRLPHVAGGLYAADLCGAALGCVGTVLALFVLDPVSACLFLSAMAAYAGWRQDSGDFSPRLRRFVRLSCLLLLAAAAVHATSYRLGYSHLGVMWAKQQLQENTLFERWNAFSRVRVTPHRSEAPFGWGFGHERKERVQQYHLDIDADAATIITRFDGNPEQVKYLANDVINSAYGVRDIKHTAVIGVGGGRDILSALYFGAKRITAIEINPAIFEALTDKFANFSGRLHERPGVSLINAEARSYLNQSRDRYDLIQISLIDTWAATAAGGLTLSENRLYTVEAWQDFYRVLSDRGMLSVSRWYDPKMHPSEFYRLLAIAAEALRRSGVAAADVPRHLLTVSVGRIVTVISSPSPFTPEDLARLRKHAAEQRFTILVSPNAMPDATAGAILTGKADKAFFHAQPMDITPSTDDRPFFFYNTRFLNALMETPSPFHNANFHNEAAISVLLYMLAFTLLACVAFILRPLAQQAKNVRLTDLYAPLFFFSGIGLAFMLIEISQMQRLMVFLGHPVYGLSVVLFTLLLFGGLGSFTVRAEPHGRLSAPLRLVGLLTLLLLAGYLTPAAGEWGKAHATGVRILVSVALLAPAAFFMGMMFPMGLHACRERQARHLPFFWGTNGTTSVLASVLGMILSMEIGIAATYGIGVITYALCAATLLWIERQRRRANVAGGWR